MYNGKYHNQKIYYQTQINLHTISKIKKLISSLYLHFFPQKKKWNGKRSKRKIKKGGRERVREVWQERNRSKENVHKIAALWWCYLLGQATGNLYMVSKS